MSTPAGDVLAGYARRLFSLAEEAERALADELRDLDENQRELLQRFASTVARRLAHLPLAGLRAAAAHASTDAVDAFFREARLRHTADSEHANRPTGTISDTPSVKRPR